MMRLLLALLVVTTCSVAHAQSGSPFDYRFGLFAGGYFADVDTNMRWDSNLLPGTEIGLESNLGMKDNDSAFTGSFEWRFFNRHALSVSHFQLTRSGLADAPFNIVIDGETIPVGAEVSSSFKAKVTAAHYDFAFIKRDNLMLEVGLGLSVQDLKVTIEAADDDIFEQGDVTAPLPTITFGLNWAITPSFIANVDVGWFDLKVDNVKGEITELNAGVTWKPWERFGFNLAYNYFDVTGKVTDEEGDFEGRLNYEFKGPIIGVIATF